MFLGRMRIIYSCKLNKEFKILRKLECMTNTLTNVESITTKMNMSLSEMTYKINIQIILSKFAM